MGRNQCLLACAATPASLPLQGVAQQGSATSATEMQPATGKRDGQNDFDFAIGIWHTPEPAIPPMEPQYGKQSDRYSECADGRHHG
jgi:hypothetical protein